MIYGQDGRREALDHPDASLRKLAQASTVTMMRTDDLYQSNPGNITFNSQVYGDKQGISLCSDQPFRWDPSVGWCSGTLIDDDLVLTAGHCVTDTPCAQESWVFNFSKTASGILSTVTSDDVFTCAEVLVQANEGVDAGQADYAIVRLDRSARPRFTPAPVRSQSTPLEESQRLGLVGSPEGIPLKIDSSGSVRSANYGSNKFIATVDAFPGNSGSAVYETDSYQLSGILVAGEQFDYVSRDGGCNVYKVCPETGCLGAQVNYAWQ
ncbi:MAG TPA: serine protease, partial [Polyangiaceae bacterium]